MVQMTGVWSEVLVFYLVVIVVNFDISNKVFHLYSIFAINFGHHALFNFCKLLFWLRITDDGSVPEMCV